MSSESAETPAPPIVTPTPEPIPSPTPTPSPTTTPLPTTTPTPQPSPSPVPVVAGPFVWQADATWGACEASCGKGQQTRPVRCFAQGSKSVVEDSKCSAATRPANARACTVANAQCDTWIRSAADFINLKSRNFKVACLESDVNMAGNTVDDRFISALKDQVFDGCGHSISNLNFRTRGLFEYVTNSTVRDLSLKSAKVSVKGAGTFATFGVLADQSNQLILKNIDIEITAGSSIELMGFGTNCGGVLGATVVVTSMGSKFRPISCLFDVEPPVELRVGFSITVNPWCFKTHR